MSSNKKKPKEQDRHSSTKMVRLPEDLHEAMKEMARSKNRPLTWEIVMALKAWLKADGRTGPWDAPDTST